MTVYRDRAILIAAEAVREAAQKLQREASEIRITDRDEAAELERAAELLFPQVRNMLSQSKRREHERLRKASRPQPYKEQPYREPIPIKRLRDDDARMLEWIRNR